MKNKPTDQMDEQSKKFFQEQLRWAKEQDEILEQIELKLYEMRDIAQYAAENDLSPTELNNLNNQLKELKIEIQSLERQRNSSTIH